MEILGTGVIESFEFNHIHREIKFAFALQRIDNKVKELHYVNIGKISGFMWVNGSGVERYIPPDYSYVELTAFHINENPVERIRITHVDSNLSMEWCEGYELTPNIVIEIGNQILFVEADEIEINGETKKITFDKNQ